MEKITKLIRNKKTDSQNQNKGDSLTGPVRQKCIKEPLPSRNSGSGGEEENQGIYKVGTEMQPRHKERLQTILT